MEAREEETWQGRTRKMMRWMNPALLLVGKVRVKTMLLAWWKDREEEERRGGESKERRNRRNGGIVVVNELTEGSQEEAEAAKLKLETFKAGGGQGLTSEELRRAKTIVEAVLHPDTQEPIPAPFRVAAFGPANIPICAGMLMMPQTQFNVVFWQWVNQSYNAGFNYSNRNANSDLSNEKLAAIYAGATTISCGIALGLGEALKKLPLSPTLSSSLFKFVPYMAVAGSNVFNLVSMRSSELAAGIPIKDKDGRVLGLSKEAGRSAILQGAITRVVIPAPVLLFPPIIMRFLDQARLPPRVRPAVELFVIVSSVFGALPCAIGLFPQESSVPVSKVEREFHGLKSEDGEELRLVVVPRPLLFSPPPPPPPSPPSPPSSLCHDLCFAPLLHTIKSASNELLPVISSLQIL
eukprot:707366-Hanusia_phi.AAC.1